MEFVLDNKWFFLVGAEVTFWVLSVAFLAMRYLFDLNRASVVVLALIILDNALIAGLGFLDFRRTGEFSAYQLVAAAIVVYGLTYGTRDFRRLDAYLKRKVAGLRGKPRSSETPARTPARDKAQKNRRSWYVHLVVFAAGQAALVAASESWILPLLTGGAPADPSFLMNAGRIWAIAFVVDTIWSLSYTPFPGKSREQRVR
jgi:hypothetical protein